MRLEVAEESRGYVYRIALDGGDRSSGRRSFSDARSAFELARQDYRVELPETFTGMHPDVHALAIWHVLRPLVGSQLVLPFAVSEPFAEAFERNYAVRLPSASARQPPRALPTQTRPCMLLSGGMDSMAAALVFPADAEFFSIASRTVHRPIAMR